ncbi:MULTISPECIES: hypothetical protein [Thermoactinomyces]|uniref:Uncharacterized protein n=1 Tax=Thermoactinomyces daqus TaxID=1329516 RepID=A0A7W1XCI9_9BACL|nr:MULTISPECIES: hypothetical protein [Thermoactinomyces]MBA4544027.1 hypothetical protein [Thermoactinomyces daqus]MBH8598155.1 hypothetical protein [Thermoactinomyces sp. CICC 10523]MBH8603186.1 hypothetical protein [Thermoactinomyces sp. CICC 10522]MBH8607007.1 hypothetical protein [Thermoactinomyces sp. CICC 10521]
MRFFSYIAPYLFQLFSLLAIILPVAGGVLALVILWRIMKSLERISQSLSRLVEWKERGQKKEQGSDET